MREAKGSHTDLRLTFRFHMTGRLAVYDTQDVLYAFNGGWLYNNASDEEMRREVDREILFLRTQGDVCYICHIYCLS